MATTLTREPSNSLDTLLPLPALLDTHDDAPVLPVLSAELSLPGCITLSHGSSVPVAAPAWRPESRTDALPLRRSTRLADRLFHWSVVGLMLLSGGIALERLLWMGQ